MSEKPQKKERYEDFLQQVEEAVRSLEEGKLGLEESIERYETGMTALNRCKQILEHMEKRIELLVQQGDGSLASRPLDMAAAPEPVRPTKPDTTAPRKK